MLTSYQGKFVQVLPEASITEEEGGAGEVEEEEEQPPQAQALPSKGPGGLFGRTQQLKAQPQEPEVHAHLLCLVSPLFCLG